MTVALVTGATGFVGSHIVERCLRQGDAVRALARPTSDTRHLDTLAGVERVTGDLADAAALDRATRGVDVVYHAAARVEDFGSRRQFFEANVEGTRRLLEAARRNGVRRFVFVSSPSVVADGRDQLGIDETYPYPARFQNLYCETKAAAERLVLAANGDAMTTCALRPRGVWGPRDWSGPMARILAKLRAGRLPDLSGGRRVLAAICHCENAAAACVGAAASDAVGGRAYFITDAEPIDVWAFIARLAEAFGLPPIRRRISPRALRLVVAAIEAVWKLPPLAHHRSPPLSRYGVGLLTLHGTYDLTAARRDFGYAPAVDLEAGLAGYAAWVASIGGVEALTRGR